MPVLTDRKYSSSIAKSRTTRIWVHAKSLAFRVILLFTTSKSARSPPISKDFGLQRFNQLTIPNTRSSTSYIQLQGSPQSLPAKDIIPQTIIALESLAAVHRLSIRRLLLQLQIVNTSRLPQPSVGSIRADNILPNLYVSTKNP